MRKKILWTLLLIPLVLSLAPAIVSAPPPPTYLYVDPPIRWDLALEPGMTFSVDIKVSYISHAEGHFLWAYQIELYVNPDVLYPILLEPGTFMESAGAGSTWVDPKFPFGHKEPGKLWLFGEHLTAGAGGCPPPLEPEDYPEGTDGHLCTVTFEVVGEGTSCIEIGPNSALVNKPLACGDQPRYINPTGIPEGILRPPESENGFFSSMQGPQLYIFGFIWPDWFWNAPGVNQALNAWVYNYGEMGASVKVKFTVTSSVFGTQTYWSNEADIDAHSGGRWPEIIRVETEPFMPPGPALYFTSAVLYFKVGCMEDYVPFQLVIDGGGKGRGSTRDIGGFFYVYEPWY